MSTTVVLIISLTVFAIVVVICFAQYRTTIAGLARDELKNVRDADDREARRGVDAAVAALHRPSGPEDGTVIGVHVGGQIVRGKRVMRSDAVADGWIVLEAAELLDGAAQPRPLGGRQWLADAAWMQEMS
jgi:hypothetical protein